MATSKKKTVNNLFPKAPKTYAEYLDSENIDYMGDYRRGLRTANLNRAKSSSGYGALADELGSLGLDGSGYAEYLERSADEKKKKDVTGLKTIRDKAHSSAVRSYSDYLVDYETDQIRTSKSIRTELEGSGVIDKSQLYLLARGMGADERYAKMLSESVYEKGKAEKIEKLLPQLLTMGADYETSKSIGLEMGLDKSGAEELAERVKFYYGGYNGYADSYLKYRHLSTVMTVSCCSLTVL